MISRVFVVAACLAAIVLPILLAVLYGVSSLLGGLGDASGALAVSRMALVCGILWGVDLVCLVLMLGANSVVAGQMTRHSAEHDTSNDTPASDEE